MKLTNKEIKNILTLIDDRINKLKQEKNSVLTIKNWIKIQNNLVEDFNKLIDLEQTKH
jgi:hypothetical protein|tara:strand:+ start:1658 stop:1831 length:174 start_codon:yes stop_codon:yes gene_type:complete